MKNLKQRLFCSFLPLLVGVLVAPSVLLYVKVVYDKIEIFKAIQEVCFEGEKITLLLLPSLTPFLLLTGYLLYYTSDGSIRKAYATGIGGIIGALMPIAFGYISILHSPGSSTAGLGFIALPIISILPMCFLGYIANLSTKA